MDSYRHPDAASLTSFSVLNPSLNLVNSNPSTMLKTGDTNTCRDNGVTVDNKPTHTNTFVHKLFNMVLDDQYQHLIAWNYVGSSFIVCNIMDFSKDVLPKHFKHNNFSSFVRQLNMYGFHKVNKSPRGHRTLAENQIWEFSHPKFLRKRPDLLDDIKRKAMEADNKSQGDIQAHLNMMQMSQTDIIQQINHLFDNFNQVVKELSETKKRQESQSMVIKQLAHCISQQNGGKLPPELNLDGLSLEHTDNSAPSIFVTSHESPLPTHMKTNINVISGSSTPYSNHQHYHHYQQQQQLPRNHRQPFQHHHYSSPPSPSPLTVKTQNLPTHSSFNHSQPPHHQYNHSFSSINGLSPLASTFATSVTSTSTGLTASDDDTSLYSPRTPTEFSTTATNNNSGNSNTASTNYDFTLTQRPQCK